MEENSCSESSAPLEFTTDILIESSSGLSVAVERCPLCSESKRPFYCAKCVGNGQFIHSSATFLESYSELQRKRDRTKAERDQILKRFQISVKGVQRRDDKRMAIDECCRNIELLKKSIAATKELIKSGKTNHEKTRRENLLRYAKGKKHKEKKRRIVDYIEKVSDAVGRKRDELATRETRLMEIRQGHINDLTTYIFDVADAKSKGDSMTMGASDEVRKALQEASQTAYVRGRWIYSSGQYRIVTATLPSHGEYSQYNLMVARSREEGASETAEVSSAGISIIAGLCYTSHLVNVLAHILNISLPSRQCYSDFCLNELSEKQFTRAVSRLNKNILYLCFSQGVNTENLEPKHTLHNVIMLLNHHSLGRIGAFDVVQDMIDSVEDSNGNSESSDDEIYFGTDEPDASEWERVPDNIPQLPEGSPSQSPGYMSQQLSESTLSASGVLSSAVSSFASFFKR